MTDEAWIDTVRLARDMGTVRELFPKGIDDIRDLPHTCFNAIRLGLTFLGFEELPEEDIPPRRIWMDGEKLEEHFNAVRARRKAQAEGKDTPEIEDPVENEAAAGLIVG